jgi:hypothetical protein
LSPKIEFGEIIHEEGQIGLWNNPPKCCDFLLHHVTHEKTTKNAISNT